MTCGTMGCAKGFLIESISCFTRSPFSSSRGCGSRGTAYGEGSQTLWVICCLLSTHALWQR